MDFPHEQINAAQSNATHSHRAAKGDTNGRRCKARQHNSKHCKANQISAQQTNTTQNNSKWPPQQRTSSTEPAASNIDANATRINCNQTKPHQTKSPHLLNNATQIEQKHQNKKTTKRNNRTHAKQSKQTTQHQTNKSLLVYLFLIQVLLLLM